MKKNRDIFTGIELGSDKIRVVVASFQDPEDSSSDMIVRGFAEIPSLKVLKDEPVVPSIVADQLAQALTTAMEGINESPGYFARVLSGNYIRTNHISATIQLDPMVAIAEEHVEQAMKAVNKKANELEEDDNSSDGYPMPLVGHIFRLADNRPFFSPVGQSSSALTAESLCFPTDKVRLRTIDMLMQSVMEGYRLNFSMYAPIAVYSAIFPPTYADDPLGLVIDLGAGVTSYAIPTRIGFVVCEQLGVGIDHLANDLSCAFSLNIDTARKIVWSMDKYLITLRTTKDGSARLLAVSEERSTVPQRRIIASEVEEVLEMRMREVFQSIKQRLEEQDALKWAGNEVLLTGVGATLPRVTDLASSVFERHARVALPYGITGRSDFQLGPQHAMVLGLLRAAHREARIQAEQEAAEGGFMKKVKNWFTVALNN